MRTRRRIYPFFSVALAVLPRTVLAAPVGFDALAAFVERCSGLREPDAGLITIGELDAGRSMLANARGCPRRTNLCRKSDRFADAFAGRGQPSRR